MRGDGQVIYPVDNGSCDTGWPQSTRREEGGEEKVEDEREWGYSMQEPKLVGGTLGRK